jgi:hypothetical protein
VSGGTVGRVHEFRQSRSNCAAWSLTGCLTVQSGKLDTESIWRRPRCRGES